MKPSGIGGQAVIEGIMMKNKDMYSVAVRKPDGEIEVNLGTYRSIVKNKMLRETPLVRGVVNFVDSMILGLLLKTALPYFKITLNFDVLFVISIIDTTSIKNI